MKRYAPSYFGFLLKSYLLGLLIFSLFRLAAIYLNWDLFQAIPQDRYSLVFQSIFLGIRFDTLISVYFLALPFLLLVIRDAFFSQNQALIRLSNFLLQFFYGLGFFIAATDIPYFLHFNYRLTTAALMWVDEPKFVLQMILQEPSYWLALVPLVIFLFLFSKLLKKFAAPVYSTQASMKPPLKIASFLMVALVLFMGLRGRLSFDKAPLGPIDAYFSDYSIANQLSLNPVFTFLRSYVDGQKKSNRELKLMDSALALKLVKADLKRSGDEYSPIAQTLIPDSTLAQKPNVVLVIMEGLSAVRMQAFGSTDSCTPFLDSLANEGRIFKNIYSAGIHTHNGIYGTLTGFPALFERHAMKQMPILKYQTLARELGKQGYQNTYFTNHDVEFDNVGGFLTENGFKRLIGDRNYPPEKLLSTLGVPDDYMFDYAKPYLNEMAENENPFLAVFMTTSNHKPYQFPEYYQRKHSDEELDAYAYADWSLKQLIENSKKEPWFDNTIFIFIADHGWAITPQYDLSLNHSHVPLIFYGPKFIRSGVETKVGGQIDLFPSLMGLLKLPYTNYSMGIDLFKQSRPYMYFNGDNKMGVIDEDYVYIYRRNGPESLHRYPSSINEIDLLRAKADSMKQYGFSNMQVAYDLIQENNLGPLN